MATQVPALGQLTPSKSETRPLPALGTATADQWAPFQVSDAADWDLAVPCTPTATQLAADVQDMPSRAANELPFGPVHLVTVQALPFHTSAKPNKVDLAPEVKLSPAAAQCPGE